MSTRIETQGLVIQDSQLHWQPLATADPGPAAAWRNWLEDPGSLTARLKSVSDGDFRVQVLGEEWLTLDQLALRGLFGPLLPAHRFWSRRVLLRGRGEAWVAAHTLIPEHALLGELREIVELSTRPLGEYLFSHPELMRATLDITRDPDDGWGRRSLFYLHRKPIMVAEFFLPALLADS